MRRYSGLIVLARKSLEAFFEGKELEISKDIKEKYSEKKSCFVTLTLNGELRGCVGSLEARQELWRDVVENSRNAAFSDSRFPGLTFDELKRIKIEVSVLSVPEEIVYKAAEELKKKIFRKGVIIKKGWNSATYLPQVWDEIKGFEDFIGSLCRKAGLSVDAWKGLDLEVSVYTAEKTREK